MPGVCVESRPLEGRSVSGFLASATSEPSALLIEGEPGIGKTTLWLAALELALDRGFRVLSARAAEAESVLAYAALADLLDGVPASAWGDLPEPQRAAVDQVLLRAEDGSATDQRAVAAAFLSVVEYLTDEGPLLVAIDDLQWIDPSSMHVVAFAARRLSGPIGILGSVRTDAGSGAGGSWLQMPRPDAVNRIRLNPLSIHDLHAAVSARLRRPFSRRRRDIRQSVFRRGKQNFRNSRGSLARCSSRRFSRPAFRQSSRPRMHLSRSMCPGGCSHIPSPDDRRARRR